STLRRHSALYASVSAIALLAAGAPAHAYSSAASALSPAALAGASTQQSVAARAAQGSTALMDPGIQAQIALSAANLAKATQAFANLTAAQAAARASSQLTLNNVPLSGSSWNGTPLSGLNPAGDPSSGLWVNADALQKDTASSTATVKQTAANALLTWQSLDLNKGETLVFDQL